MYKVGVVGLGNIAMGYSGPEDAAPYTHAGGINHSQRVELAAVADISEGARAKFREKWGHCFPRTRYYDSYEGMLAAEQLDIISICIRGPHHHAAVLQALAARPRAIFLEKPPTCSLAEMDEIVAASRAASIPITVSYSRHWAPSVLRVEQLVKEGLIGKVNIVVGYCGESLLSFASHTTDLICQFAGYCPTAVYARGDIDQQAPAGYEPEPSLSGMIVEFANGTTGIQVGTAGDHGAFYCDVTGSEGRARAGIYIPPFACNASGEAIDLASYGVPEPASPFKVAYDQIADHLDGGPLPACTGDLFVAVHEIGFGAIESLHSGRRVELPNANRARRIFANG